MHMFSGKRSALALAIAGITAMLGFVVAPQIHAEGFIDDSTLTGGTYYWQRECDRKDVTDHGKYKTNLSHSTWNANLDFQFGYAVDMFGVDIVAFTAIEINESSESGHPNEIAFPSKNKDYNEDYSGDKGGISLYKTAAKFKYGPTWARAGYIQPIGQILLAPHWSFVPGTYQGAEAGANFDYGDAGALSFSCMWANEYRASWHTEVDKFYQAGKKTSVNYPHSIGTKYNFKNNLSLGAMFGQSEGCVDQCFAKASCKFDLGDNPFTTSCQFYGTRDKVDDRTVNDIYDGTAWSQALTPGYGMAEVADLRLEGTWVKADGQQGYFSQHTTPTYASSNDRLGVWQDNRSDFNANGEKAVFSGAMYDLRNWNLPGWAVGASYVCAWDAKPSTWQLNSDAYHDKNRIIEESSYSLDAVYTLQDGHAKGTMFKLYFTQYDNHSDIPSWGGGYGNMFQDERDVKSIVITSFTIL